MEKNQISQRKQWLDALRGLAIFLVVLLHSIPGGQEKVVYILITGPIKLPLFFAISGYVFNIRDGKQGPFFLNLLRKILIPSLVFFIGLHAPSVFTRGFSYLTDRLWEFVSGDICWYITACIVAEILFFYNLKFCKRDIYVCLVALLCCVAGFLMAGFSIGNFMMINRAFVAQFYLLLGYLFRRNEEFFKKLHWGILAGVFALAAGLIALSYWLWPNRGIDVHMHNYYGSVDTIPFSLVLISLCTVGLMILGVKVGKAPRFLAFFGQHTLLTYIWHGFFLSMGMRVLPLGDSEGLLLIGKCILLTLFAVTVCSIGSYLVDLLLPELKGRKRRARS